MVMSMHWSLDLTYMVAHSASKRDTECTNAAYLFQNNRNPFTRLDCKHLVDVLATTALKKGPQNQYS